MKFKGDVGNKVPVPAMYGVPERRALFLFTAAAEVHALSPPDK